MNRKGLISVLVFLCAMTACVDSRDAGGDVFRPDPVGECVVPQSVHAGEDAVLQWNGFADDARIILRSDEGTYDMVIDVLTGSGLIFIVPFDVVPGDYELVLVQQDEIVLGRMTVLAPELPVSGLSVPSGGLTGDFLIVGGVGFDSSSSVMIVGHDGIGIPLESFLTRDGLKAVIPEELKEGEYSIYLVQNGFEWEISHSFRISSARRKLVSITSVGPYMGSTEVAYTWTVHDGDPLRIVLSEAFISPDETEAGAEDVYEALSSDSFALVSDGFESSNDVEMSYMLDSDGRVAKTDVLIYGKDQPTEFSWNYNASGALDGITYQSKIGLTTFADLEYQDGNIVFFKNSQFEYGDPALKNAPYAPDVIWAYMALMNRFDPFPYFPYLLGWYDVRSSLLPTAMSIASGSTMTSTPLSYEFDDKGYVVEMSWVEGSSMNRLLFDFED